MIKLLWILCAVAAADCEAQSCQKNVTRDHLLLQRKVTSKMSKVAGNSNSTDSTGQCDKEFVNLGSDGEPGMTECQGDCDEDSDCAPGLRCKQRRWNEEVPGCHGHSYARMDYCYNPSCESMPELDSSYGSQGAANMPKCAGDCDEDSDCAGTLKCFQRDGRQAVPGCAGSGVPDFDYCYEPDEVSTTTAAPSPPGVDGDCLCVFDIDRTLTGKQGTAGNHCPQNMQVDGIWDYAYSPGWLTISEAGQNLQNTFCNQCYLGIVSAGWASGPSEKNYLLEHVLISEPYARLRDNYPKASRWSRRRTLGSPLVLGWEDRKKQDAVEGIVTWYARRGITIPASKVTFFGDRTENIGPFSSKGYNSREISCASRDQSIHNGMVGYCGALSSEIVQTNGVKLCTDPEPPEPLPGDMHETPPPVEMEPTPSPSNDCLCVFDIDRTLTGKQGVRGHNSACPNNKKINFVWDAAYSGGWLHLSEVGQNLKKTFCKACYLGVVSAGTASGRRSAERKYLLKHVLKSRPFKQLRRKETEASKWSSNGEVKSPLVLKWPDRQKQHAVQGIVEWYGSKGIQLAPFNVHFFGDRTENIGPFRQTGFNSHEISCSSRDYQIGNGIVGLCGAQLHEILDTKGVAEC